MAAKPLLAGSVRFRPFPNPPAEGYISATLLWSPDAPLLIDLLFNRQGVCWSISRDLLSEGLATGTAGEGDVRITPARGYPELFALDLTSPHGSILLCAPRADLAEFVAATYEVTPDCTIPLPNDHDIQRLIETTPR